MGQKDGPQAQPDSADCVRMRWNSNPLVSTLLAMAITLMVAGCTTLDQGGIAADAIPTATPEATTAPTVTPTTAPSPQVAPTSEQVAPAPAPPPPTVPVQQAFAVPIPDGHDPLVLELPAAHALGGLVLPGSIVTLIATTPSGPDGSSSAAVLGEVEVIDAEVAFDDGPGVFLVTIALKPDEATIVNKTVEGGQISLAGSLQPDGRHPMAIHTTADQPLHGGVRPGDSVSVVSGSVVVLGEVRVLSVSSSALTENDPDGPASMILIVAVEPADITILAAAIANGDLTLALPA